MSALAPVAGKNFNGKFTAKINFPIGYFMLPLLMRTVEVLKSLHILFDKYLYHMLVKFELNPMVGTTQNYVLFGKKMVIHFMTKH